MAIDILSAFTTEPQPIDFVLPGLVAGSVGAIVSPGGAGKSMLALQLAATLAGAGDMLGLGGVDVGRTLYMPGEDPEITILHRLHALGAHLDEDARHKCAMRMTIEPLVGLQPNIMDQRWTDALVRAASGCRLLILDTLRRFHTLDENDGGAMAAVVGRLEYIAKETGCSIVFLHHTSKAAALAGSGDMQQASRGSSVLVDNIRWQAFLATMSGPEAEKMGVSEDDRRYYVRFGVSKVNYGSPVADRWFRRAEGGVLVPDDMRVAPSSKKSMWESIGEVKDKENGRDVW